ncbi:DeoR/GlpR family DNA-binding transcription regulator [Paenibacillus chartarius]|uniref:DeoR/GlpR family DNA-binding transcription regulator n=1 Tax=Paenibacillus chartarius TaxID=747481 RepID=A0ABV6DQN0_9BACL
MNQLRRYEIIMELLLERREVSVAELSDRLQVTGKTIREDLAKLEERGLLVRVHGGAMLAQSDQLGILRSNVSDGLYGEAKAEIAGIVQRHIEPGDIVALDGGSTTLEIARRLDNIPITVVTNDLYIINELTRKDQIRLVVPGGYRVRNMLTGPEAVHFLQSLNIHKAFLSATGIHLQDGLSIYTSDFIEFKMALLRVSRVAYAVADHRKFGRTALRTFAPLTDVKAIITDSGLSLETAAHYRAAGVDVITP